MQKCYNCGKEVDDTVLICPECGALVKRYGRPEPQQAEPQPSPFTFQSDAAPQPQGAVWRLDNGKLKFRGYITAWLVVCAVLTGYTAFGFCTTLFVYRFRDLYLETLGQVSELLPMVQMLQQLLVSVEAYLGIYIALAIIFMCKCACTIWFAASKKKLPFYLMAGCSALLLVLSVLSSGNLSVLLYVIDPLITWLMLRRSWSMLR